MDLSYHVHRALLEHLVGTPAPVTVCGTPELRPWGCCLISRVLGTSRLWLRGSDPLCLRGTAEENPADVVHFSTHLTALGITQETRLCSVRAFPERFS